jgi:hypothetical protein
LTDAGQCVGVGSPVGGGKRQAPKKGVVGQSMDPKLDALEQFKCLAGGTGVAAQILAHGKLEEHVGLVVLKKLVFKVVWRVGEPKQLGKPCFARDNIQRVLQLGLIRLADCHPGLHVWGAANVQLGAWQFGDNLLGNKSDQSPSVYRGTEHVDVEPTNMKIMSAVRPKEVGSEHQGLTFLTDFKKFMKEIFLQNLPGSEQARTRFLLRFIPLKVESSVDPKEPIPNLFSVKSIITMKIYIPINTIYGFDVHRTI